MGKSLTTSYLKFWWISFFFFFVILLLLYSDCLRRESTFLASTRRVTALCVRDYYIVCLCDCIMVIRKPTRK